MGALDYFSAFCSETSVGSKRKSMQTVEIKVKMDCDGCERRVRNAVTSIRGRGVWRLLACSGVLGVSNVEVLRKQSRVTVTGYVDPRKVLERVKSTGKRAEFWPYISHNLVYYPYATNTYDRRAPAGYVRNVVHAIHSSAPEENLTSLFSDDNPHACIIM